MSWKRAEAAMDYCKASLKGIGKLSGCIGVEYLYGLLVSIPLTFCLVLERKWLKMVKILKYCFSFPSVISLCYSFSEGFDFS